MTSISLSLNNFDQLTQLFNIMTIHNIKFDIFSLDEKPLLNMITKTNFNDFLQVNSSGKNLLFHTLGKNYPEVARVILSRTDVDIGLNLLNTENESVLMYALQYCPTVVSEIMAREDFIQWNCVNIRNSTALHFAIFYERKELAVSIARNSKFTNFNQIFDHDRTALNMALRQNYPDVARAILSRTDVDIGLNTRKASLLIYALQYCPTVVSEIMAREDFTQWNCVNIENSTALHIAIDYGRKELAVSIARNPKFTNFNQVLNSGKTALHFALAKNYPEVAHAILSRTDVDIGLNMLTTNNDSVLIYALWKCPEIAPEIMAREDFTQWNCVNIKNTTVLHFAIDYERKELAVSIARNPKFTNFNHVDNNGDTALQVALYKFNKDNNMMDVINEIMYRTNILKKPSFIEPSFIESSNNNSFEITRGSKRTRV